MLKYNGRLKTSKLEVTFRASVLYIRWDKNELLFYATPTSKKDDLTKAHASNVN